jgi:superfamily II DNA helicase RecQ
MVSVLSLRQELVISEEEGGGFELELCEREEGRYWWEEYFDEDPYEVEGPAFEPVAVQEEARQVVLPVEPEGDMFKKLSALRKEIAYAQGLPPYIIFHDKALWEMVEAQPQNLAEFGNISGVGRAKLEKYGERFLAIINGAAA